jgi:hypothetical protein
VFIESLDNAHKNIYNVLKLNTSYQERLRDRPVDISATCESKVLIPADYI